jgi:hypothetical protein
MRYYNEGNFPAIFLDKRIATAPQMNAEAEASYWNVTPPLAPEKWTF